MADGLSQSDLDALFADITLPGETNPDLTEGSADGIKRFETSQRETEMLDQTACNDPGSDNLSQDQIDELLKQFLG